MRLTLLGVNTLVDLAVCGVGRELQAAPGPATACNTERGRDRETRNGQRWELLFGRGGTVCAKITCSVRTNPLHNTE